MFVKICGLSNGVDAQLACNLGASALGFVMGGKCLPVEVEPPAQWVKKIIQGLPASVETYIVTHLSAAQEILDLANYVNSTGIQISEEVEVSTLREVRQATEKKIIKTIVVRESSLATLKAYESFADYILLDTESRGYIGGTGETSDWALCRRLVAASSKPVLLAGGLTAENVEQGIKTVQAFGVDVSTGVSTYSDAYLRKDRKCPIKISDFIRNARKEHI